MFDRTDHLAPVALPPREIFDRRYEGPGRPALFEGALEDLCPADWTCEALAARCPEAILDGYRVRQGHLVFDEITGLVPVTVRAADLPGELASASPTLRVRHRDFAQLAASLPVPSICRGKARLEANLWISPAGARSQLHFDQPHTLLLQLVGQKRVLLFAPGERRHLHPFPWGSSTAQFSQADVAAPDFGRFPGLARARGVQLTLAPGQALFVPGSWWHYLDASEPTVSLGWRWWGARDRPRLVLADLYKRLRGQVR